MLVDPMEDNMNTQLQDENLEANDYIIVVESSDEWTTWRQNLALEMFNTCKAPREVKES